ASASGYFELPMTRAKRSPAADEGAVETTEKRAIRRRPRRMFIPRRSRKRAPALARASATLLYASGIIKPRSRPVNRLQNRTYCDKSNRWRGRRSAAPAHVEIVRRHTPRQSRQVPHRRECLNVIGLTLGFVGVIPVKPFHG